MRVHFYWSKYAQSMKMIENTSYIAYTVRSQTSDLYYPWYFGVVNFGLKNRGYSGSADNRGMGNRGLTVLHLSWAY